jgi:hypothetical protein
MVNSSVILSLAVAVLAFVIMGIITVVGVNIIVGVQATQTAGTIPYAISGNTTSGLTNISNQLPLMGTILVFGAVIALLLAVFWFRGTSGSGNTV